MEGGVWYFDIIIMGIFKGRKGKDDGKVRRRCRTGVLSRALLCTACASSSVTGYLDTCNMLPCEEDAFPGLRDPYAF